MFEEEDWLEQEETGCAGCMKTFNFHLSNLFSVLGLATQVRWSAADADTFRVGRACLGHAVEHTSCSLLPFVCLLDVATSTCKWVLP